MAIPAAPLRTGLTLPATAIAAVPVAALWRT